MDKLEELMILVTCIQTEASYDVIHIALGLMMLIRLKY